MTTKEKLLKEFRKKFTGTNATLGGLPYFNINSPKMISDVESWLTTAFIQIEEEARREERKQIYEGLHKEVNKYFIDPLFPNLKIAITETLFKVMPETKRTADQLTQEKI